jgi:hypothetical protein
MIFILIFVLGVLVPLLVIPAVFSEHFYGLMAIWVVCVVAIAAILAFIAVSYPLILLALTIGMAVSVTLVVPRLNRYLLARYKKTLAEEWYAVPENRAWLRRERQNNPYLFIFHEELLDQDDLSATTEESPHA